MLADFVPAHTPNSSNANFGSGPRHQTSTPLPHRLLLNSITWAGFQASIIYSDLA